MTDRASHVLELAIRRLRVDRAESKTPGVELDDAASQRAAEALLRVGPAAFAERLWIKFPNERDDAEDDEERLAQHARRVDYLGHAPPSSVEVAGVEARFDRLSLFFRAWPRAGQADDAVAAAVVAAVRLELWPDLVPPGLGGPIFVQTTLLEHEVRAPSVLPIDLAPRDYQEGWSSR